MKRRNWGLRCIVLAGLIPEATALVTDTYYGELTSIPITIVSAAVAAILWLVLWLLKCPRAWAFGIIIAATVVWSIWLGFELHDASSPESRFESLTGIQVPESVRDLKVHGRVSLAGGDESLLFSIDPSDVPNLIRAKPWTPYKLHAQGENSIDRLPLARAQAYDFQPHEIYRIGRDSSFLLLMINSSRDQCMVYSFEL